MHTWNYWTTLRKSPPSRSCPASSDSSTRHDYSSSSNTSKPTSSMKLWAFLLRGRPSDVEASTPGRKWRTPAIQKECGYLTVSGTHLAGFFCDHAHGQDCESKTNDSKGTISLAHPHILYAALKHTDEPDKFQWGTNIRDAPITSDGTPSGRVNEGVGWDNTDYKDRVQSDMVESKSEL